MKGDLMPKADGIVRDAVRGEPPLRAIPVLFVIPAKAGIHLRTWIHRPGRGRYGIVLPDLGRRCAGTPSKAEGKNGFRAFAATQNDGMPTLFGGFSTTSSRPRLTLKGGRDSYVRLRRNLADRVPLFRDPRSGVGFRSFEGRSFLTSPGVDVSRRSGIRN